MYLIKKNKNKNESLKVDMEHLRKLFIMPDSPDKFLDFGYELLDLIHNIFMEKGGIHSSIPLPELEKLFSNVNIPQKPQLLKDVISEIKTKIVAHSVKVGNPYYIGHMTSAIPYFMILIEMFIAALNQNQVKIESAKASTFVERELISWMHKLVFCRDKKFYEKHIQNYEVSLGNVTLDGTLANLTALLVARNKAFPPDNRFPGIRKAGINEAYNYYGYKKAVILVSKRGHYSIDKISRIIGIGDDNIIKVPVDSCNKIDINELESICENINYKNKKGSDKTKIIAIVGIGGTTETGNIDNLKEIARIAKVNNTYFHVDAAWGGSVMLVDELRYMFEGIQSADSVSIDAHKLLFSPVSMGMVLFSDETALNCVKHYSNYIIRQDSVDLGRFSIEGSRPFSALKPWATFKILGTYGFKLLFDHAFELTSDLRGLIEKHCDFEPMNKPELFIFNYRFVPKRIKEKLNSIMLRIKGVEAKSKGSSLSFKKRIERINNILNELNVELHKELREEDDSFVSRTMLDSPLYFYQDVVVLRAITINPLTTRKVLNEIIESQDVIGQKIYNSGYKTRLEGI